MVKVDRVGLAVSSGAAYQLGREWEDRIGWVGAVA